MQPLKYYITESTVGKCFMGRTIVNNNYNDSDFIKEMCITDPEITDESVKKIMKSFMKTAKRILSEGNSITISKFLRISPIIKGSFENVNDTFNQDKNYVGIACTPLQNFVQSFQSDVNVEKISRPANMPQIFAVENNKNKDNSLTLRYANRISGTNFVTGNHKFKGIKIIDAEKVENNIIIDNTMIDVLNLKKNELYFSFDRDFTPPVWMTDNHGIFIQMIYESIDNLSYKESDMFYLFWSDMK